MEGRVRAARANEAVGSLPVLVVDVGEAEETAALIRAGASDAVLGISADEDVARKLWRLVRRRR